MADPIQQLSASSQKIYYQCMANNVGQDKAEEKCFNEAKAVEPAPAKAAESESARYDQEYQSTFTREYKQCMQELWTNRTRRRSFIVSFSGSIPVETFCNRQASSTASQHVKQLFSREHERRIKLKKELAASKEELAKANRKLGQCLKDVMKAPDFKAKLVKCQESFNIAVNQILGTEQPLVEASLAYFTPSAVLSLGAGGLLIPVMIQASSQDKRP